MINEACMIFKTYVNRTKERFDTFRKKKKRSSVLRSC